MDKQSSSINQWTKGSNNDSKSTQKNDFNNKTTSNYNSFEFLDMSSCNETQKLKLQDTLNSSSAAFSTQRERYRSNFAARNPTLKPPQQYSATQYHANASKSQKPNYQFYQTKHPNSIEHVSSSSRSFPSEVASNFSSKNNSNFNNNTSTLSNTTNIRLDDNRIYPNPQEKLSKWHSNIKKPPYVGLRESAQVNQKDLPIKRTSGLKESMHYHKELSRDQNKNFANRNMSPPVTSYQTNTTSSTTSSSPHQVHMSQTTAHYHTQQMYPPQIYSSGSVPLIQQYPIHYPPGQPMIPPPYGERNDMVARDSQNDHQSNTSSQHQMNSTRGSGGNGRRGRSRGGSNNMPRRDYHLRQNNLHQLQSQQPSVASNEYGQPLMEQPQVMSSGPYQPFYIHHYPPYFGPNVGGIPGPTSSSAAQNLTGQPLFAIQQPVLYQYGSPYPIMYNMMPPQGHAMSHQQADMPENDHNQNQESGGAAQAAVIWPHVAYQEPPIPQQIFQHSPHINPGEVELEFTDEYHLQMMSHPNSYALIPPDQVSGDMVVDEMQLEETRDVYVDAVRIDNDQLVYDQDSNDVVNGNDTSLLIEKTRDLMIQTEALPPSFNHTIQVQHENERFDEKDQPANDATVPNQQKNAKVSPMRNGEAVGNKFKQEPVAVTGKVVSIDNKLLVQNKEKPPAWGNVAVPNLASQALAKKQTSTVSVSAIPHKDAVHLQNDLTLKDPTILLSAVHEVVESPHVIESKPSGDKSKQPSFSSITASKQSLSSPTSVEGKKTENRQNEIQPLQKQQQQQQIALSERAKQQIVTTITGGTSNQETTNKQEAAPSRPVQNNPLPEEEAPVNEKQAPKQQPQGNTSAAARATWAGLFNASDGSGLTRAAPPQQLSTVMQNQNSESQASTAKNPDSLPVQPIQVPGVMSYSAVSAQSLPALPVATLNYAVTVASTGGVSDSKLPQSKLNLTNNNNNHVKSAPVDQHAVKLGDFFSKYKIESNSVSLLPRGLLNKSNYCYINAILQALVACPPFYHLMKAIPQMPLSYRLNTKTPVTDAMVELVSNYSQLPYRKWVPREKGKKDDVPEITRDSAFEPVVILKMLQALRTDMFPVEGRQEDAEEFLSLILNRMNDEMIELKKLVEKPKVVLKKEETPDDVNGNVEPPVDDSEEWQVISGTRNKSTITRTTDFGKSPISDIFGGKLRLRVHREGDHSSDNIEPFFTLKLVIEKASSVREALEILVGRDQLEGVTCSRGTEVAAWQQVTLEELPVVLILHLKCFDFKKDSCTKILKSVEFPVELKIDPKIMSTKNKYQQRQKQYKLFAVVYHDGKEASKGHYITDVFHVGYSSWIRYDDSTVKAVPEGNVLHPKPPRVPYLLYYRRYDTIHGQRENSNNLQSNQKSTK